MDIKKPIIGVTPQWNAERKVVRILPEYLDAISAAGGIPVVLPLFAEPDTIQQLADSFDGFLFTGGPDVSPELYGESDRGLCVVSPVRDAKETQLLKAVLKEDKPVLGICRGIQIINAALGGTLWQDIPSEHPSEIVHRQEKPYDNTVHTVSLQGKLKELLGKETIHVNSRHHQAVRILSPKLSPAAFSPDGLIEAVEMPGKRFFLAVQWHPENLYPKNADAFLLFESFINACRE